MLIKLTVAYAHNGETLTKGDIIAVTETVADNLFLKGYATPAYSITPPQEDNGTDPLPQENNGADPPPQEENSTDPPPTIALGRSQNSGNAKQTKTPKKKGKK